jgi:hypothetical protein
MRGREGLAIFRNENSALLCCFQLFQFPIAMLSENVALLPVLTIPAEYGLSVGLSSKNSLYGSGGALFSRNCPFVDFIFSSALISFTHLHSYPNMA